ncbi:hypothetical protein SGRIM128S_04721 [Streptomyces griseomycini]
MTSSLLHASPTVRPVTSPPSARMRMVRSRSVPRPRSRPLSITSAAPMLSSHHSGYLLHPSAGAHCQGADGHDVTRLLSHRFSFSCSASGTGPGRAPFSPHTTRYAQPAHIAGFFARPVACCLTRRITCRPCKGKPSFVLFVLVSPVQRVGRALRQTRFRLTGKAGASLCQGCERSPVHACTPAPRYRGICPVISPSGPSRRAMRAVMRLPTGSRWASNPRKGTDPSGDGASRCGWATPENLRCMAHGPRERRSVGCCHHACPGQPDGRKAAALESFRRPPIGGREVGTVQC